VNNTVLVRGINVVGNAGCEAMAISTMRLITESIPDSRIITLANNPELVKEVYSRYGYTFEMVPYQGGIKALPQLLRAVLWRLIRSTLRIDAKWLRSTVYLKTLWEADVVADITSDALNQYPFSLTDVIWKIGFSLNVLVPYLLKKPLMLLPGSMGPFNNRLVAPLLRFALNRATVIVFRDEISRGEAIKLGITKPEQHLTADIAFLLKPETEETIYPVLTEMGIKKDNPLIGINVSQLAASYSGKLKRKENYLDIMVTLADYLVDVYNAQVLLVPHGFPRRKTNSSQEIGDFSKEDDFIAVNYVYDKVKNKERIVPLREEYSASELKGFIALCDMFIGARMHSLIAAISSGVPTIGIAYSLKTPGFLKLVGLEEYMQDVRTLSFDGIREKIDDMWGNRQQIRKRLSSRVEVLKKEVWLNGKILKRLQVH